MRSNKSNQGYFRNGSRRDAVPEALNQKDASRKGIPEPFFLAIGFRRLGVSCYPTALLSNKLTYFIQFLKKNTEFWVTLYGPEPISPQTLH